MLRKTNYSIGVMEAETISKNAASPKSQMSRGNILTVVVLLMLLGMGVFSCTIEEVEDGNFKTLKGTVWRLDLKYYYDLYGREYEIDFVDKGDYLLADGEKMLKPRFEFKSDVKGSYLLSGGDGDFLGDATRPVTGYDDYYEVREVTFNYSYDGVYIEIVVDKDWIVTGEIKEGKLVFPERYWDVENVNIIFERIK